MWAILMPRFVIYKWQPVPVSISTSSVLIMSSFNHSILINIRHAKIRQTSQNNPAIVLESRCGNFQSGAVASSPISSSGMDPSGGPQKQKHLDKSDTRNATLFGLTNTDSGRTKDLPIISDWTTSPTKATTASEPVIPNHLNGLKPLVIEPYLEKTTWKRWVILKLSLFVACLVISCLAFAAVAYQYRFRKVPKVAFNEGDEDYYEGDVNILAVTEDSTDFSEHDYESDWSYSSHYGSSLESSSVDNIYNSSRGQISLEDIDLRASNIRLVGGPNQYTGRVEILRQGSWGTICHQQWNREDGRVACRQLGFGDVKTTMRNARFGQGTGKIWFTKVRCAGSEPNLYACSKTANVRSCTHAMDASVRCEAPEPTTSACDSNPCKNGGTCRNTNGGNSFQCTCTSGWSGSVCTTAVRPCDSDPCYNGATCRNNGGNFECTCATGWNGRLCNNNINECSPNPCQNGGTCTDRVGGYDCQCTSNYSGTNCENAIGGTTSTRIRLVGGSGSFEGRVEVYYNGIWGTVCDDKWDKKDADVVCRMLGFTAAYEASRYAAYGSGSSSAQIWLDNVACVGNEDSLLSCSHNGWGNHNCDHREDAGVSCLTDNWVIPDVTVRLVGGTAFAGRVEVWRNGVWGTICDDYWGMEEAEVVCRQLGYSAAVVAYNWADSRDSHFGERDGGEIWLDNMQCAGSETRIEDCPHAGWSNNNCVHDLPFSEQAGVMCYNPGITAKVDLLNTGNCGTRPLLNRIVGGENVVDKWPWMGSLRDVYGNHRCGTSLISSGWAITAAHCDDVAHKVYFGDLQLSPQSSTHQESTVQVFRNPNYNSYTIDNDFTLLKLDTPLTINGHVRPICLAVSSNEESFYPDGTCKAVGWGHLEWEGYVSRDLQEVDLDIITESACQRVYSHITDNMICTDDPNREAGTCQGDSGGPLQCVKNGVWHLIGATSHGYECGGAGIPDVFARVSRYWQFIKQTVDMNGGP
ncbi:neurotrypsin-like isoform X2 [Amphiura filiformis]|uniref:neurotrypsin-like isoform X2 n=1 Tax=Amphiura filiformis TaxID=82378 RepID=UPI003B211A8E